MVFEGNDVANVLIIVGLAVSVICVIILLVGYGPLTDNDAILNNLFTLSPIGIILGVICIFVGVATQDIGRSQQVIDYAQEEYQIDIDSSQVYDILGTFEDPVAVAVEYDGQTIEVNWNQRPDKKWDFFHDGKPLTQLQ